MEANIKYLAVARVRGSTILAALSCDFATKEKVNST
jgi:hypothetical protein